MALIYDCFSFYNEEDVLLWRLTELYPVVHRFVLVEATHTHSGQPKPLYYSQNAHRFAEFRDKIIPVVVANLPEGEGLAATRRREMTQRNAIMMGLMEAPEDARILISDLDEIPRRECVKMLENEDLPDGAVVVLLQKLMYYNLNTQAIDRLWPGTRMARLADVRAMSPHIIRNGIGQPDIHYPVFAHLHNAGWHCSYFGDVAHIQKKMRAFLHQELVSDENLDADTIARRMSEGIDIWGRESEQQFVIAAASDLPTAVRCDLTGFQKYFHPDWRPEFHEFWYPQGEADMLNRLVRMAPTVGECIEIGCWEGRSTTVLAQAIAPRIVHAVDHWRGNIDQDEPVSMIAAKERDVHATFTHNMRVLTAGNVQVHRQDWRDWAATWDQPIAFAHIDASHDYKSVYDCLIAIKPYLVQGAILCGDDAYADGVFRGVKDALGDGAGEIGGRLWVWQNNQE